MSALEKNDDRLLRQIYRDLPTKIKSYAALTNWELHAQIGKTSHRNLYVEAYIPKYAQAGKKSFVALIIIIISNIYTG